MNKPFFVMLYNQAGDRLIPLCDESGELMMFDTRAEANLTAIKTVFGDKFGWDTHEAGVGCGEYDE